MKETEEEIFFKDKLLYLLSTQNCFLQMPTMICFNFCLKEMIDLCDVNSETGNKKYFELAKDFLEFLKRDNVLKKLDFVAYINTIKKLKEFIENRDKINCTEIYNYFKHIKIIFGKKYITKLFELIRENLQECKDYNRFDFLIETIVNELLSMGYTYKFLNEIVQKYVYENIFESPQKLIEFLLYEKDNYDIYIPLKCFNYRDQKFIKNSFKDQDIQFGKEIYLEGKEFSEDTYYCHIYFNGNDYYKEINKQLRRIKSIFNFEKFYIGSNIDFDEQKLCIIKSNRFLNVEDKSLNNILRYDYYKGNRKVINSSTNTLKKLTGYYSDEDKKDSLLARDLFNIIDYSEKDNNILSIEQFINKWISLETLYSKSSTKSGVDSIINYMPHILAIDFFRKEVSFSLKRSLIKNGTIENFIKSCYDNTIDEYIQDIDSKYYKILISRYKDIIVNPEKLNRELNKIIQRIRMNVNRIYIFRNKYVHTGDTRFYYDIPQYVLYQLLATSIDKFIKSINDLHQMEASNITWDLVYNSLLNKYNTLFNGLKMLTENLKVDSNMIITKEDALKNKDSIESIILKIILEKHINLFEHQRINKKNIYTKKYKAERFHRPKHYVFR